jgi:hypothetical protein
MNAGSTRPEAAAKAAAEGEVVRERGWGRVVVVLLLFLIVPITPLRLLLPVEQLLLLLLPALAVCAVVGWWLGGRLALMLLWVGLAAWVLFREGNGAPTAVALTIGWSLLLATAFGVSAVAQSREAPRPFLPRALGAIALSMGLTLGAVFAVPDGAERLVSTVQTELNSRSQESLADWRRSQELPEWKAFAEANPDWVPLMRDAETQLQVMPRRGGQLFPALLALESLVALALAWALYHRVGRTRLGPPLARVREFRFSDQLVWGFIVGLVLVIVPGFAPLQLLGYNLLLFFGALYAARGFGVLVWFLAPGRIVTILLVCFTAFFWYIVGPLALGVGVGDTWLDWRARAGRKS